MKKILFIISLAFFIVFSLQQIDALASTQGFNQSINIGGLYGTTFNLTGSGVSTSTNPNTITITGGGGGGGSGTVSSSTVGTIAIYNASSTVIGYASGTYNSSTDLWTLTNLTVSGLTTGGPFCLHETNGRITASNADCGSSSGIASTSPWTLQNFVVASGTGIATINATSGTYYPYYTNPLNYLTANQSTTWTGSGDVTGTASGATSLLPTLHTVAIQGKAITSTAPTDQQYLKYVNANSDWEPSTLPAYITSISINANSGTSFVLNGTAGNISSTVSGTTTTFNLANAGTAGSCTWCNVTFDVFGRETAQSNNSTPVTSIAANAPLSASASTGAVTLSWTGLTTSTALASNQIVYATGVSTVGSDATFARDARGDLAVNASLAVGTSIQVTSGTWTGSSTTGAYQSFDWSNANATNTVVINTSSSVPLLTINQKTGTVKGVAGFPSTVSANSIYGGTIAWSTTATGNGAGASTSLMTYTLPTSTFETAGDEIDIYVGGTFAGTAATNKEVQVYVSSTPVFDTGQLSITSAASWFVETRCTMLNTTSSICVTQYTDSATSALGVHEGSAGNATAVILTTGSIPLTIYGDGTNASDVVANYFRVIDMPGS